MEMLSLLCKETHDIFKNDAHVLTTLNAKTCHTVVSLQSVSHSACEDIHKPHVE